MELLETGCEIGDGLGDLREVVALDRQHLDLGQRGEPFGEACELVVANAELDHILESAQIRGDVRQQIVTDVHLLQLLKLPELRRSQIIDASEYSFIAPMGLA